MNSAGESKLSCVANSRYNNSKIQALHACRTSCLKILSFMNSAGESKLSCVANSGYNNSKIQALHACRTFVLEDFIVHEFCFCFSSYISVFSLQCELNTKSTIIFFERKVKSRSIPYIKGAEAILIHRGRMWKTRQNPSTEGLCHFL